MWVALRALLVMCLLGLVSLAGTASSDSIAPGHAPAATRCPGLQYVDGLGAACPSLGGWEVTLEDGAVLRVHGGDPVPPAGAELVAGHGHDDEDAAHIGSGVSDAHVSGAGDGGVSPLACAADPLLDQHARLLYVIPRHGQGFTDQKANMVRSIAETAGSVFNAAAGPNHNIRIKVLCDGSGAPAVERVRLDEASSDEVEFANIVAGVRRQGHVLSNVHYWIWFDGFHDTWGGFGNGAGQGAATLDNHANSGEQYAVTFGWESWWLMLHELSHNMGAVSGIAPHTTGALHCNDGWDVMCYDDGGPSADYFTRCWDWKFDCGADDYFHPAPPRGNYLFDHWNLASPLNLFVEVAGGCTATEGVIPSPWVPGAPRVEGVNTVTISLQDSCGGRHLTLSSAPLLKWHVCWRDNGLETGCENATSMLWTTVPPGADEAQLAFVDRSGGPFRFMVN